MQLHKGIVQLTARILAHVPSGRDGCRTYLWRQSETPQVVETAFMGAVVLRALRCASVDSPELTAWCEELAAVLRTQESTVGTWNYWLRSSALAATRPCPDDLDTTTCAMTALAKMDANFLDPARLARVVHVLTSLETNPGGPYRTWVVSPEEHKWGDVDPVVNAHVGWFLAERGISLPRLEMWVCGVADSTLVSPYYPSRLPFLYAVSHWYKGSARERLCEEVRAILLATDVQREPLNVALAVTALCNFGESREGLVHYVDALAAPADDCLLVPYWIDGIWGGTPTLAGSPLLTLALCREALCRLAEVAESVRTMQSVENVVMMAAEEAVQTVLAAWCAAFPAPLRERVQAAIAAFMANEKSRRRVLFPWRMARAVRGESLAFDARAAEVCAANVFGWLAYTWYDDILDGDADASVLGAANACMRQVQAACWAIDPSIGVRCGEVFDRMDAANTWELETCSLTSLDDGAWQLPPVLPGFGDAQLWERSLGVAFMPLVLLGGGECQMLERLHCHLIAARQLADDTHDWEEDLLHGRCNSVAVRVLQAAALQGGDRVDSDVVVRLRPVLWEQVLDDVTVEVRRHCDIAQAMFAESYPQADGSFIAGMAAHAIAGMEKAVATRNQTKDFLAAYSGA